MSIKPQPGRYTIYFEGRPSETLEITESGANLPPAPVWFWLPWEGPPILYRFEDDGTVRALAFLQGGGVGEFTGPPAATSDGTYECGPY